MTSPTSPGPTPRRHDSGDAPPLKPTPSFFPFRGFFLSKKTRPLPPPKPAPPPHPPHDLHPIQPDLGRFSPLPSSMPDFGNRPFPKSLHGTGSVESYGKPGLIVREDIPSPTASGKPVQRVPEDLQTLRKPSLCGSRKEIATESDAAIFLEEEHVQDVVRSVRTKSMPDVHASQMKFGDLAGLGPHQNDSFLHQVHDDVGYVQTLRKPDFHERRKDIPSGSIHGDASDCAVSPLCMFLCAICNRVMEDPVVVASGQSYDSACFQKWLEEGITFCPKTKHRLVHFNHAPNLALSSLISLHSKMGSHGIFESPPSQSFLCFLCQKIMEDPVIVSSGETYDRACIQKWRDAGFSLCPITQQPLSDRNIIRNVSLEEKISSWWNTSPPPSSFVCDLCSRVMEDPVVTTSGQTYDKACLQDAGYREEECLAPNLVIRDLISCWLNASASHGPALDNRSSGISRYNQTSKPIITTSKPIITSSLPRRDTDYSQRSTDSSTGVESASQYVNPNSGTPRCDSGCYTSNVLKDSPVFSRFFGNVDCISDGSTSHTRSSLVSDGTFSSSEYSAWMDTADLDASLSELVRKREQREELRATYKDGLLHGGVVEGASSRVIDDCHVEGASSRVIDDCHVEQGNYSEDNHSQHISRINELVSSLQSEDVHKQRKSAEVLRIMARTNDDRILIANAGAVDPLLTLSQSNDKRTQIYATTTLLNISLDKSVGSLLIEKGAIMQLVGVVKSGLSTEAKGNAAMALSSIWKNASDDIKITSSVAIPPLIELLYIGSKSNKKDAASALYRLSTVDGNKRKMIRSGICRCLLNFISDNDGLVEKAITLLKNLVAVEEGRVAFVADDGISIVLDVIKKGSKVSRACGVSILLQIGKYSKKHKALLLKKDPFAALIALLETANENRKAEINELLQLLNEPT